MDGDFQSELTWRDREAMIRAAHRRWLAAQRKTAGLVARMDAQRGPALDPIDEMIDLFGGDE